MEGWKSVSSLDLRVKSSRTPQLETDHCQESRASAKADMFLPIVRARAAGYIPAISKNILR